MLNDQIISLIFFKKKAESLLSTYGAESGMLGDMDVAINSLKNFTFQFSDASEGIHSFYYSSFSLLLLFFHFSFFYLLFFNY